ncbi:MAG: carboxymuconolactone decarboxylase family protein [Armatimonadota bacterium]
MAWIRVIGPNEAEGELARYYEESRDWSQRRRQAWGSPTGEAPEDRAKDWTHNPDGSLVSLNPAAARAYLKLGDIVHYGEGPLSQVQRQMIATVVSARNHCVY